MKVVFEKLSPSPNKFRLKILNVYAHIFRRSVPETAVNFTFTGEIAIPLQSLDQ
jgi:hypothetical protein